MLAWIGLKVVRSGEGPGPLELGDCLWLEGRSRSDLVHEFQARTGFSGSGNLGEGSLAGGGDAGAPVAAGGGR
jgi:hypothetical protein